MIVKRIEKIEDKKVTFLLMDNADFVRLCNLLRKSFGDDVDDIENDGWLPVMTKNKQTRDIFITFGVNTKWVAAAEHGLAKRIEKPRVPVKEA